MFDMAFFAECRLLDNRLWGSRLLSSVPVIQGLIAYLEKPVFCQKKQAYTAD